MGNKNIADLKKTKHGQFPMFMGKSIPNYALFGANMSKNCARSKKSL